MIDINELVRNNIKKLVPYSSAREEYRGENGIFLDANENPIGSAVGKSLNRYPDPLHSELRNKIAAMKGIDSSQLFVGNGSDEAIDLLIRAFCEPRVDKIMIMPPTYGMYQVCAEINDIQVVKVSLTPEFKIDMDKVRQVITDKNIKLLYLCSPNNPTGNCLEPGKIEEILTHFKGLVIIDEAYIDFSGRKSWAEKLGKFINLVLLQTFSKVWGLANIRLGFAIADPSIISILDKIKYPYNVNGITQRLALEALARSHQKENMLSTILKEKEKLKKRLLKINIIEKIYQSDANFFLIKFKNAKKIYTYLVNDKVIVRDRSSVIHCENCLRVSVGTADENNKLIELLNKYE